MISYGFDCFQHQPFTCIPSWGLIHVHVSMYFLGAGYIAVFKFLFKLTNVDNQWGSISTGHAIICLGLDPDLWISEFG